MSEMSRFDWEDPFLLDDQLSDDARMIRDAARSFTQERLQPGVIEACAKEHTDPGISREMAAQGLLGGHRGRGVRRRWRVLRRVRAGRA
jgi:glutaryl-CoA dehydrogenase